MEEFISTKLGSYTLLRRLVHGGMSEVYLASDQNGKEAYVLKVVSLGNKEYCWRFQHEARMLSELKHQHIIPVLEYGEQDGVCYYAMPYIESGTLKERIAQGPLSLEEAGVILEQVADAVQFLHEAGFIHRDIKPTNILLSTSQQIWLADFGLLKAVEADSDITTTGQIMGTPSYMAPEQIENVATVSSDIYALGILVYEMLTGVPPFRGKPLAICLKHLSEQPPLPSTLNPLIPPALEQIIMRTLAKDPATRFCTARSFAQAYHTALLDPEAALMPIWLGQMGKPSVVVKPIKTRRTRRPLRSLAIAALLIIAMLLTFGGAYLGIAARDAATVAPVNAVGVTLAPGQAHSSPAQYPSSATPGLAKPPTARKTRRQLYGQQVYQGHEDRGKHNGQPGQQED